MKRIEDSLRDLWDNIKCTNTRIIGIPEEEEEKNLSEKIFEEIIVENFLIMGKEIVSQIQKAQRVPYRISPRRNMPRHINQTIKNQIQRKNIRSSKGKATSNIQGKPCKVNS